MAWDGGRRKCDKCMAKTRERKREKDRVRRERSRGEGEPRNEPLRGKLPTLTPKLTPTPILPLNRACGEVQGWNFWGKDEGGIVISPEEISDDLRGWEDKLEGFGCKEDGLGEG